MILHTALSSSRGSSLLAISMAARVSASHKVGRGAPRIIQSGVWVSRWVGLCRRGVRAPWTPMDQSKNATNSTCQVKGKELSACAQAGTRAYRARVFLFGHEWTLLLLLERASPGVVWTNRISINASSNTHCKSTMVAKSGLPVPPRQKRSGMRETPTRVRSKE